MFDKLPDWIDPVHCAEHNMRFQARVNQRDMPRLMEQVCAENDDVQVTVAFKRHPKLKTPQIDLSVKAALVLECQRTLEPYIYPVESRMQGVFLSSMAMAEDVDEGLEIFELPEGKISLLDYIEDELLLAIPMVPRQESVPITWQDEPLSKSEVVVVKENPFAKLKQMKE